MLLLSLCLVGGKVKAVDALPRLVRSAPRATNATVVERSSGASRVRVGLDVVAVVVGNVATEAAVEVEEVGTGDDNIEASSSKLSNIGYTVVPSLDDDITRNVLGGGIGRQINILPHHKAAVLLASLLGVHEDGHGVVEPVLVEVSVVALGVLGEPLTDGLAEVEATGLELVTTNVEPVVAEAP